MEITGIYPESGTFTLRASSVVDSNLGVAGEFVRRNISLNGQYQLTLKGFSALTQNNQFPNTATNGYPIWFLVSPQMINQAQSQNFWGQLARQTNGVEFITDIDYCVTTYLNGYIDFNVLTNSLSTPSIPMVSGSLLNPGTNSYFTSIGGTGKFTVLAVFDYKRIS